MWRTSRGRFAGSRIRICRARVFGGFVARLLGGRTNHWNCVALRFSEHDMETRSRSGYGVDWPLSYADLAPYYEKVERYVGVHGTAEGIPSAPDGVFLPPPKPRCSDRMVQRGCARLGIPCIPGRAAIITRNHRGRAKCHYCGQCTQGCHTASRFASSQTLIPDALDTGRLEIRPMAMARKVLVGTDGKARGVSYVDKTTGREQTVLAKAVWVGASACESARLLLNSKSSAFPDGLANGSGMVGRNLLETTAAHVTGIFEELGQIPPHNHDGTESVHVYLPWWKYDRKNEFFGGYHTEVFGGPEMPRPRMFQRVSRETEGYGVALKQRCREDYGTQVRLYGRGEMVPNPNSYCEIDPDGIDEWGIPTLRFHLAWTDNEVRMAKDMYETYCEIIEAAGGKPIEQTPDDKYGYLEARGVAHELGTVAMGRDRRTSPLNGYCQAHDVKNLFVSDGACFTTNPDKNPTISILALSWRAAEYFLEQARRGDV